MPQRKLVKLDEEKERTKRSEKGLVAVLEIIGSYGQP